MRNDATSMCDLMLAIHTIARFNLVYKAFLARHWSRLNKATIGISIFQNFTGTLLVALAPHVHI